MDRILNSKQVGEILGLCAKVIERMARRGDVPAFKAGKFWRYRESDLERWINSQLQSSYQPCRLQQSF